MSTFDRRALQRYFQEISRIPVLTPNKEIDLARRIKQGDQEALSELTRANLRFVVSVAKKYQGLGLSLIDLINEGNYGLVQAAKQFDESRGCRFITYAVWGIRKAILQALARQGRIVRLPTDRISTITKVRKMTERLQQRYGRQPTLEELAEALEMKEEKIQEAMQHRQRAVSVDAPTGAEGERSLLDLLATPERTPLDEGFRDESLRAKVEWALEHLSERESEILRLFFGIGQAEALTMRQIAQRLGLSYSMVTKIKERALIRLRWEYVKRTV